jgi:apolipoprotein N-acyltransferase
MASQATIMEEKASDTRAERSPEHLPAAAGQPVRSVWPVRGAILGASLATAGLLWLSYFPVAWGWLGWVALVPLLPLVRARETPRLVFLFAWLAGVAFFVPALWWMHAADGLRTGGFPLGPMTAASLALAIYCALYFPAAIFLLRRLDQRTPLPLVLTLPVVWTALEFFRSFFGTGFAWYFLSHTQHAFLPMIQISDLAGAYAVTFLVAAVNAIAFEWLYTWPRLRALLSLREPAPAAWRLGRVLQSAAVAVLLLAAFLYGCWRLGENAFTAGPRLALLQGNVEQRLRNRATAQGSDKNEARQQIIRHYSDLGRAAARQEPHPELIVWPETSFPRDWWEIGPNVPPAQVPPDYASYHELLREVFRQAAANDCGTSMLLGLNTWLLADPKQKAQRYNSALLVNSAGLIDGRYDKIHRVPFGEYVPLRDWLPFMDSFAPYDFDYSIRQGESLTRFPLGPYHFGVLICFEDGDPDLARQYGKAGADGPAADFLVEISNDGWFDGTAEHEEHLALCRFRAIETRRSIARAVNMGISVVIDGNGRVLAPLLVSQQGDVYRWEVPYGSAAELPAARWRDFKQVQGVLTATVPIDQRTSLYALWGDWLPAGCWLLIGAGLAATWLRRRPLSPPPLAERSRG